MEAECDGEVWITTHDLGGEACPLETTCPLDPPTPFAACDAATTCLYVRSSECPDGQGYDILTFATCMDGVWQGTALAEGTMCPACSASLPTCEADLHGLVCELDHGEAPCIDVTGWATGTVGTLRSLRECRDSGWEELAGAQGYTDCSG